MSLDEVLFEGVHVGVVYVIKGVSYIKLARLSPQIYLNLTAKCHELVMNPKQQQSVVKRAMSFMSTAAKRTSSINYKQSP